MYIKSLLVVLSIALPARALADGAAGLVPPPNVIAAAEHAASVYKDEIRNITAQTEKMRKIFNEIPSNDPDYVAYKNSSVTSKSVMDRQSMMQQMVETRANIQKSFDKIERLSDGMARLDAQYPGIANRVDGMKQSIVRGMLETHNAGSPEATMRTWESFGGSRLALDDEEAQLLQKPLELKFSNGQKITIKPGAHVKVRFTQGDAVFEGPVIQSQPGWHDPFIMLTKDPRGGGDAYFGVRLDSIESVEVQNADGTVNRLETHQPSNAQLRSESVGLKKLGDLLTRTRARTGGGGGVIEAVPMRMGEVHASF